MKTSAEVVLWEIARIPGTVQIRMDYLMYDETSDRIWSGGVKTLAALTIRGSGRAAHRCARRRSAGVRNAEGTGAGTRSGLRGQGRLCPSCRGGFAPPSPNVRPPRRTSPRAIAAKEVAYLGTYATPP